MKQLSRVYFLAVLFLSAQLPNARAQTGTQIWSYTTAFLITASQAVAPDGTIYVPSYENIYAMTPGGSNKWVSDVNNFPGIYGSPAVGADGTVYFGGSVDGVLYALDPTTGANKWTYSISAHDNNNNSVFYTSPAIGTDGAIYIGSYKVQNNDNPYLYAFNTNGTLRWRYAPAAPVFASAAISQDGATIYFGADDGKLYALSTNGTTLRWAFNTGPKAITAPPAIGRDGRIYIGVGSVLNPKFYCVNTNGTTNWVFSATNRIETAAAIGDDGTVYFGSADMHLYALNTNGTLKWAAFTGGTNSSSPALAADGTIYMGSENRKLYAFDNTGSNLWTFTTGNYISCSPSIATNGTVYVCSADSKVYAITGASGPGKTPWPMFQHDLQHTARSLPISNTLPVISTIAAQTNNQNTALGPLVFTVFDSETPAANLVVVGVSSNTTLLPNNQIVFSGTSSNRFVTITPATNQSGTSWITLTVTDAAGATNSTSFLLTTLAGNQPPVFTPVVTNRVSGAGITLMITNSVIDPDSPPQTLTFSLLVSPAGSTITTNGVLVWRPAAAQANTTNSVSVKVADSGTPSLTATQSFLITINPLAVPTLKSAVTNGQLRLTVSGDFGPDYLVQASTNLFDWSPVLTNNSPTLPFIWNDTGFSIWPVRFYRIVLRP